MSILGLGSPGGLGFWVGERPDGQDGECKGQFTSSLRERWTDPITARRVPSKWKKGTRGARGILCTNLSTYAYIGTNAVMNDTSCILRNNNDRNECC
jgi:hypothetical protein